ncbi:MAG: helix-turn-helix transcriptional regulator [Alphaproteobacteria bacterium]|nr:helix-turn-helix transcriptional regulator [Alphaproteobacteria bacterium]
MDDRVLYTGLIRLHVLHHAVKEPIYGLAMIEEPARHGYKRSASNYPDLHGLEERGYLTSTEEWSGGAARRTVQLKPARKLKVRELFGELFEQQG